MNNNSLSNEKQLIGEQIQQWVLLDNKLKEIQEQQKLLRTQKQELNGQICSYMKRTNNNKIIFFNQSSARVKCFFLKKEFFSFVDLMF